MESHERLRLFIGCVIAILLQVFLAPIITISSIVPNFIMAFCIVATIPRGDASGVVLPFVMGLIYDFIGGGPVGAMAFLLVLVTFAASRVYMNMSNDTLFVMLAFLVVCVFVTEFAYGIVMLICGLDASLGQVLLYRCLPCSLYDCVIVLIMYPIAARFLFAPSPLEPGSPILH
ncbi:MAG: rod shape-determining protein MreD [Eggerthellaceae bacterium]|nr:rod shape-determining protein MreD [Eggerthellaceae bacterium]